MQLSEFKKDVKTLLERELNKVQAPKSSSEKIARSTIESALKKLDKGIEDAYNFYAKPTGVRAIELAYYLSRY